MNFEVLKNNKYLSKLKKERIFYCTILFIFTAIIYYRHIPITLVSDDAVMGLTVSTYSFWDGIIYRWMYNGRIMTDVFANIWYRIPLIWWKLFDTGVYVLVAILLSRIFTQNRWYHLLLTSCMVLLFPFNYMDSAGYIATSSNYIYPLLCVLVITFSIKIMLEDKKISIPLYLATAVSIIYSTNHDQTSVALLVGLFCFYIYCLKFSFYSQNKYLLGHLFGFFLSSVVMYLFYVFLVPGHAVRRTSTAEMERWLPEYADWSFFDKAFHGYTSTVSNIFFNDVMLFTIFTILLLIVSIRKKEPLKVIIGCIPFAGILISHYVGSLGWFIYYPGNGCGMVELMPVEIWPIPFIFSVIMLIAIFIAIWLNINNLNIKLLLTLLLILAAGTREMMGFTATIYASHNRTFTFFLFALLACNLILLNELEKDKEHKSFWYMSIGVILAILTI